MRKLRIGIASYEDMKARTKAIARGEFHAAPDSPKVWFPSIESVAKIFSAGNQKLLQIIAEQLPSSLDELARLSGRKKSNLSRTLRTMESYSIVELKRGAKGRIAPRVLHDEITLALRLKKAASS